VIVARRIAAILLTLAAVAAVPAAAQAADAPLGVTGMALDGRVEIAWQPVAGATGYTVYRGITAGAVTTPLMGGPLTPPGVGVTPSFTDVSAVSGTTYFYAVRAVVAGVESPNSRVVQARPRARTCSGANVVVQENCFPGDSDWSVRASAQDVHGFATADDVDHGEALDLKIRASASTTADLEIFRSGGYAGAGARLFSTILNVPVGVQPGCLNDLSVGLYDCSGWSVSHTLTTTANWPSGVYLVRIRRDDSGDTNHILFVVRDDSRQSDVLFGVPFSTYQAYNDYGGKSLYDDKSSGPNTVAGTPRAVKVSFDRPYSQPHQSLQHDWYTRADFATVSWLERAGYDVTYTSGSRLERNGERLLDHRVFISGTHDEYWSAAMRTAAEQARDRGVDLFWTGANEVYWKIRFEPSPVSGRQDRVEVSYKSTQSGGADPSGIPTGTWRDPAGANRPENALLGGQYIGQKAFTWFPLRVSAAEGRDRIWRNTSLATQPNGTFTNIGASLVGWEWDARVSNGQEPPGVVTLASSPATGDILQDAGRVYAPGSAISHMVKYLHPSGSLVVQTGTNHWNWGLALNGAGDGEPDQRIQQATTNILADMGAAPETPAAGIVIDDPAAPPAIALRNPAASAVGVQPTTSVAVTFSRSMNGSTITGSTFTLRRPDGSLVPAAVAYDDLTFRATLTPSSPLALETTYSVRLDGSIRAANGVSLGSSVSWTFTTRPPDRTPPVVSISAPAAGETIVQSVDVRADASDDDAVASVQFKLDGANLGSLDTSAPYVYTWDARSVSAGTHVLAAVARDTSGNETTSASVSVTVDPTGLVAAYGFEEGGGATVNDASGKGNPGTIRDATRVAGRAGQGLNFDGVNDWVTVNDAASLDMTNAITLETWVRPATVSSWQTVAVKEQATGLVYGLYANTDSNRPSAHVFTTSETDVRGPAALAANTWTHLAMTYDGATLRLYANGVQVATRAVSGSMINSTGALRLGGNTVWGEFFRGVLDEVRVYRRVLTAAEIAADMNIPVVPPDAVPPSAPGALTATGALAQATLNWGAATDNVGVVRYNVHRSSAAGFTPAAGNRVAQVTGTTYTDTGLAAGTWYYRVIAEDGAGNTGPASNQASAVATADTTAPTVSISAPAGGATVSGAVPVTATANDNVAVAGVRFQVDGLDVGSEDTTSPFAATWDSTGVANGAHVIRAIARDGSGNSTTSATVTVNVDNLPVDPAGLVASYGFEEPGGGTVVDVSGTGSNGTISNATRVGSGRFGSALSFNGTNAWVTIADSAALDLNTAMTLEAWVNPAAVTSWQTVLLKESTNALAYGLYSNADTNRPSTHVRTNNEVDTRGTAQLMAGTWTHLAATWDQSTLRLYVNGALASSRTIAGTIGNAAGPLRIGGNAVWGEYFTGLIDEVRVYRRALTASEVAIDMGTPVGGGTVDTTAPTAPGGLTATGLLGRAELSWTAATDDIGVVRYDVHRGTVAGFTPAAGNRIAQVTGTSYTDAGLASGDYYYRVFAADAAGNISPPSGQASATVTADTTAPTASLTAPANGATVSGTVALAATASDNVGVVGVRFTVDGDPIGAEDTSAPYGLSWDSAAVTNGSHVLRAVARDAAGLSTTSVPVTVTVNNTAVPGLVAAYGFEESGGTALDSSGRGNTGTIREATRVAGRFGQGLQFDGVNDWITVNDADSLDLSSGMTIEAWVKPSLLTGWRTILMKESATGLAYGLYANNDTNRPSVNVHAAGGAEQDIRGTATLSTTAWTHVAATHDGSTLRLYVSGTQVATRAFASALAATSQPLRIGGNAVWNEWFSGQLDEVRVYNRALTAAEIVTDMNRAVLT
jgi:hypothetical protein